MNANIQNDRDEASRTLVEATQKYADYKPPSGECRRYSKMHSQAYYGRQYYLLTIDRRGFGLTDYEFDSDTMNRGSILRIMENSLRDGTFRNLRKITIKEYALAGGGNIPCCLRKCEYEGEWPPCMRKNDD